MKATAPQCSVCSAPLDVAGGNRLASCARCDTLHYVSAPDEMGATAADPVRDTVEPDDAGRGIRRDPVNEREGALFVAQVLGGVGLLLLAAVALPAVRVSPLFLLAPGIVLAGAGAVLAWRQSLGASDDPAGGGEERS